MYRHMLRASIIEACNKHASQTSASVISIEILIL